MRIPRVFTTARVSVGERLELPQGEARHLSRVLRRRPGDRVDLLTSVGRAYACRIVELAASGAVAVEVIDELPADASAAPERTARAQVTLGLAVVKGPSFDLALRMAAELGIRRVVPLFTARTVVRWDAPPEKERRHQRIVREAGKQCGRSEPLAIEEAVEYSSWLEALGPAAEGGAVSRWIAVPGAACSSRLAAPPSDAGPAEVVYAVGPEGGFTEEEVAAALSRGFVACGFPTPVLRTPTAVALIAALELLREAR